MRRLLSHCAILLLAACSVADRFDARGAADRVAAANHLTPYQVSAGGFHLAAWARFAPGEAVLPVYLEGDGLAFVTATQVSTDPTPYDALGLRLAAADNRPAVAYLARPCQFAPQDLGTMCRAPLWTSDRYGEAVVGAVDQALDRLKAQAGATRLELIGYSGGAAIAVLVAARRSDVAALRTVAGNLDPHGWTIFHGLTPLSGSLDPLAVAGSLARLPQRHYVGAADDIVPARLLDRFMATQRDQRCAARTVVQGMAHDGDWPALWPQLRRLPLGCPSGG